MRTQLLCGREHTALGAIGNADGERAAAAISRGGALKTYAYTDANEDAALFAIGSRGTLVAVTDGHAGTEAAEHALLHLRDAFAPGWTGGPGYEGERWYHEVVGALVAFALYPCAPAFGKRNDIRQPFR